MRISSNQLLLIIQKLISGDKPTQIWLQSQPELKRRVCDEMKRLIELLK